MKGRYSVDNDCYQPAASEQEDFTFHCLSIEKVSLGQGIAETYKRNMYKQSYGLVVTESRFKSSYIELMKIMNDALRKGAWNQSFTNSN